MITHPFSPSQLETVYVLLKDEWMPTLEEYYKKQEYVWKVLLPECFIKFYMDFFKLDKATAELNIKETPCPSASDNEEE